MADIDGSAAEMEDGSTAAIKDGSTAEIDGSALEGPEAPTSQVTPTIIPLVSRILIRI